MAAYKLEQILTPSEIQHLSTEIHNSMDKFVKEDGDTTSYNRDSLGSGNLPVTLEYVPKLERYIKSMYGTKLKFENSYTRFYRKNTFLAPHIDRGELDYTISLCVKRDLPWKFWVSNRLVLDGPSTAWDGAPARSKLIDASYWREDVIGVDLDPGDGAMMEGKIYPHWREMYPGQGNEENLYIFYHWRKI